MPNKILYRLNDKVTKRFLNEENEMQMYDGMDISILSIDLNKSEIYFSGAKNLILVDFGNELVQKKDSKYPSGGHILKKYKKIFDLHTYDKSEQIKYIYLFSDEFQDQVGGSKGKKYKFQNLYYFTSKIKNLPFDEQKQLL